jgi:hypothetical protein
MYNTTFAGEIQSGEKAEMYLYKYFSRMAGGLLRSNQISHTMSDYSELIHLPIPSLRREVLKRGSLESGGGFPCLPVRERAGLWVSSFNNALTHRSNEGEGSL